MVCTQPPAPSCVAVGTGTAVRTFISPGTCSSGTGLCSYSPIDVACPTGCAAGVCTTAGQTFSQTMPRVRFAVNAIDQAPNSNGSHVLVVGESGNIMKWDGLTFSKVSSTNSTSASFSSVWFAGVNTAYAAGSSRTIARYNGTSYVPMTGIPGSGSVNFSGIHGQDEAHFTVIDGTENYWQFTGPSTWVTGTLGSTLNTYKMSAVFVDGQNRARIVGARSIIATPLTINGVVEYINASGAKFEDVDNAAGQPTEGFGAVGGPALDGGAPQLDAVFVGRASSNAVRRHTVVGNFDSNFSPPLTLPAGNGISAITSTAPSSTSRAVYLLSKIAGTSPGHLYRYSSSTGVDSETLADFYFNKVSMGPTESGGVVVAEADTVHGINNIYRRNSVAGEMLDLGEDWQSVSSNGTSLVLTSSFGDIAFRVGTSSTWQFRRGPVVNVTDAVASNGTGLLIVGTGGAIEKFIPGTASPTVTTVTTNTSNDFNAVCRVSDLEGYAVGAGGVIRLVNTTGASAMTMTSGTAKNLLSVDCPASGIAIACGQAGTVLRLSAGTWSAFPVALPSGTPDLLSCKLVGTTLWAAGDNAFFKIDLAAANPAWQTLAAQTRLSHLVVLSPTEIYATSGITRLVRFDGSAWTTRFTTTSGTLEGGGQVGGKVVYAGHLGTVVEGQ